MGYHYLQVRKGILTEKDKTARRRFAWDIKKNYSSDLWTKDICFYLDGASFAHKYNPCDQNRAPKGHVWRQTREGLDTGCTVKGVHVGTGGRVLKLFIVISFRQGMICCEEYKRLDGEFFKSFVSENSQKSSGNARKGIRACLFRSVTPGRTAQRHGNLLRPLELTAGYTTLKPRFKSYRKCFSFSKKTPRYRSVWAKDNSWDI